MRAEWSWRVRDRECVAIPASVGGPGRSHPRRPSRYRVADPGDRVGGRRDTTSSPPTRPSRRSNSRTTKAISSASTWTSSGPSPRTRASPSTSSRWASTPHCRRCRPTRSTASSRACRSPTSASRCSTSPTRTSSPASRWRCWRTTTTSSPTRTCKGKRVAVKNGTEGADVRRFDQGQVRLRRSSPSPTRRSMFDEVKTGKLRGGLRGLPGARLRHHPGQRLQDRDAQGGRAELRVRRQQGPERRTAEEVQRRA